MSTPPSIDGNPSASLASAQHPVLRTAAYWIGFAGGLAPGFVFFAFYFAYADGLPEPSNGPSLIPYLAIIPAAGVILAIIRRTKKIGLATLLASLTAGTFIYSIMALPVVALILLIPRKTRKFGLGLLLGTLLTWMIFMTLCAPILYNFKLL